MNDIRIQKTPNPNALKYILPQKQFDKPLNFSSVEAAEAHPLASSLFALGAVYNVLLAQDFVTVNKYPDIPWDGLETKIQVLISDYFVAAQGA